MPDFLFVLCLVVVAGAAAYLGIDAIRWASRRHGRQTTTEPVSPAGTTTRAGTLWLRLVRPTATGPAPTAPGDPDETDEPAREDSGADETYADELRAITREMKQHPGFTTDEPAEGDEFDYHAALNALEDAARADIEHIWGRFYDWLGVDALTRLRLPSAIEQTGEIDRAELEAMLEGASA